MAGGFENTHRILLRCALGLLLATFGGAADAKNYRVVYSFCSQANCTDGSPPSGPVIKDAQGNLYGEAEYGGGGSCPGGCGTVFKIAPDGTETVLYQFCSLTDCADGAYPTGGLIADSQGNLYGTTYFGGIGGDCGHVGWCGGTVFKLSPDGTETVLHTFCGQPPVSANPQCRDGYYPNGGVILDAGGNIYGTTESGGNGTFASGTVFKIAPDGKETLLYSFCPTETCTDGADPAGGLIRDAQGNLYGTAGGGNGFYCRSSGCGTVFKLAPDGTETVLHSFCVSEDCPDGFGPVGTLVADRRGNLYGVTSYGGACTTQYGCGTIFEISPDGNESVLYNFCSMAGCKDGDFPLGGLIGDSQGNFYGTTVAGGGPSCAGTGCGAVFEFGRDGKLTVLVSFKGPPTDGLSPETALFADSSGHLYGTTNNGGTGSQCSYTIGCGTVFVLKK
ncbi:MAG: choice-of-anchor tandem repeat GloVer-containing protein [Rhizomicrobium sp.]